MPSSNNYKAYLVHMMNYLDNPDPPYTKEDTNFTQERLGALTADDVMGYFNFRVYGVPDPPEGHNIRPRHRSNAIKYWKKAISHFMPNRLQPWNDLAGVGNPTRSVKLNELMKSVQKAETRHQGVPSQARRAFTSIEAPNGADGAVENPAAGGDGGGGGFGDRSVRDQLLALSSQVNQLRQLLETSQERTHANHAELVRNQQTLTTLVRRMSIIPARRVGGNVVGAPPGAPVPVNNPRAGAAVLSPAPKCLYSLWNEYTTGIGGRKAAKDFTAVERGRVKHRYTRRKVVWDTVDRLIKRGYTAQVAIDRIYEHYGRALSVSVIINNMLRDRRAGDIPALLR